MLDLKGQPKKSFSTIKFFVVFLNLKCLRIEKESLFCEISPIINPGNWLNNNNRLKCYIYLGINLKSLESIPTFLTNHCESMLFLTSEIDSFRKHCGTISL